MDISNFGHKYSQFSGITQLMQDLNEGLQNKNKMIMLGGGNPAQIPEVQQKLNQILAQQIDSGALVSVISNYDGPSGNDAFIQQLVNLFNAEFGWNITQANIALTNGSQNAFFYLFNLLSGQFANGKKKKILFPLSPEYVGYADTTLEPDSFVSVKPKIEYLAGGLFKYHIDFDNLPLNEEIGLICLSRPTNPSGNVVTDAEIQRLSELAKQHNVPLLIDNAYGAPFPNILFEPVTPYFDDNTILSMSLSKFGLPGARCGIVVACEELIQHISRLNGILSLSPSGIGSLIGTQLITDGSLLRLSNTVIKPYYQHKCDQALHYLQQKIPPSRLLIHKPEGAIFLWLWFTALPISCEALYARLKAKGLLIVPGNHFFPGLTQPWQHTNECIRLNYSQDIEQVKAGIDILAEEIALIYTNQDK